MTMVSDETTIRDRHEQAQALAEKCGYAAAAVTLLPVPGTEMVAVMPIHVGMVVKIGQIHGVDLDRDSATHLILRIGATVGLSLVGSRLATTATKLVLPGLGGLVTAPFMYASTVAIGRVAELYFQHGDLTDGQIRQAYDETVRRAKRSFDPRKARSAEARSMAEAARAEGEGPGGAEVTGAAPAEAPGAAETPTGPAERLARLRRLHEQGVIDDEELAAAKRRILDEL